MTENEFEGEYLGGHPKVPDERHVKLHLDEEKLAVTKYDHPNEPLFSIQYTEISGVQNLPNNGVSSTARTFLFLGAVLAILALLFLGMFGLFLGLFLVCLGLISLAFSHGKPHLTLGFKDELGMEQKAVFKMKKPDEALRAVYDRAVEAKKK